VHHDDKRYECDECGKTFIRHDHLTKHKKIHSGKLYFVLLFPKLFLKTFLMFSVLSVFFYKIGKQEGRISPAQGGGLATVGGRMWWGKWIGG
jgi:hypothetical protein